MFSNLNPLDRPTAILEIVIMLLGAAIIGFLIAWMARKPKKNAAENDSKQDTESNKKPDPRVAQLEKALETAKSEKVAAQKALETAQAAKATLEKESQTQAQKAKDNEDSLRQELEAARNAKPQDSNTALENAKKQISELEKALANHKARAKEMEDKLAAQTSPATPEAVSPSHELEELRKENATLKAQAALPQPDPNATLSTELETLRAELNLLKSQPQVPAPAEESERIRTLERQLRDQQREAFNLQSEITKLRAEKPEAASPNKELDWLKREKEDLERDVRDLESQIDRLEKENSELRTQARDKSAAGPALDKLTKERDRLKTELEKIKKAPSETTPPLSADFSHLGTATAAEKDELTRINGIGPVVEGKLNQLGIYTYAQVSRLSPADMDMIDQVLQLFPGRVKRENWVAQAAALVK